jgi:putative transposase
MTAELKRRGWAANHKRVYRLMCEDNLLCLRKRKFIVTSDSNHPFPVYPNLPASVKPTGVNQLWVADITYIRLQLEFVFRRWRGGRLRVPDAKRHRRFETSTVE